MPPAQAMLHHRQHNCHWWSDSLFLQNSTALFLSNTHIQPSMPQQKSKANEGVWWSKTKRNHVICVEKLAPEVSEETIASRTNHHTEAVQAVDKPIVCRSATKAQQSFLHKKASAETTAWMLKWPQTILAANGTANNELLTIVTLCI